MTQGCSGGCLKSNHPCVPHEQTKHVRFDQDAIDSSWSTTLTWASFASLDPSTLFAPPPQHSVLCEDDCLYPFQAQLVAWKLRCEVIYDKFAEELKHLRGLSQDGFSRNCTQVDPLSESAVSIPEVPNNTCEEGETYKRVHSQWLPLGPGLRLHRNEQTSPPGTHDDQPAQIDFEQEPLPRYVQDLQARVFRTAGEQNDGPWYIRTWYIHHHLNPFWENPRLIRLNNDPNRWHTLVTTFWEDLLAQDDEVMITLTQQEIPCNPNDVEIVADVLLIQDLDRDESAVIFSVRRFDDTGVRSMALSVPPFVRAQDLVLRAQIDHECFDATCICHCNQQQIDFADEPHFHTEDGQGIIADIHDTDDDMISSVSPVDEATPLGIPEHVDSPAAVDVEALQAVFIYTLHRSPTFSYVSTASFNQLIHDVAKALEINMYDLQTVHYLNHRLPDEIEGVMHVTAHKLNDIPIGSRQKLVLLDVEAHVPQDECHYPLPPKTSRQVVVTNDWITRQHVLAMTNTEEFCTLHLNRCIVRFNGITWLSEDQTMKEVRFGDCIQLILPPLSHETCDLTIENVQQHLASEGKVLGPLHVDIGVSLFQEQITLRQNEDFPHYEPMRNPDAEDMPFPIDFELLAAFDLGPLNIVEAEILHVVTWYVNHMTHQFCDTPRVITLGPRWQTWHVDLQQAWEDVSDRDHTFTFMVPNPAPIDFPSSERKWPHVLIEQRRQTQWHSCLTQAGDERSGRLLTKYRAHVVPFFCSKVGIISACGLQQECSDLGGPHQCEVRHGSYLLPNNEGYRCTPGNHFTLRIGPDQQRCGRDFDHVSWMQHPIPSSEGSQESSATALVAMPNLGWSNSELQLLPAHLHSIAQCWDSTAGMEDDGSIQFQTWFVRGTVSTECHQPRMCTLPRDPTTWTERLRRTWRAFMRENAPWNYQFVHPHPPDNDEDLLLGGHIIIYQDLIPSTRAVLLSLERGDLPNRPVRHYARIVYVNCMFLHLRRWWRIDDLCDSNGALECTCWTGDHRHPDHEPILVANGQSVYVLIEPNPMQESATLSSEATALEPGSSLDSPNALPSSSSAPVIQVNDSNVTTQMIPNPREEALTHQTFFVQLLHTIWNRRARTDELQERSACVQTWFLDHERYHVCRHSRTVFLDEHFDTWEHRILRAWVDLVDPQEDHEFYVVLPDPPGLQFPCCAHVIVAQRVQFDRKSCLTALLDGTVQPVMPQYFAAVENDEITRSDLFRTVQRFSECLNDRLPFQCTAWHNHLELVPDMTFPTSNGMSFIVAVAPEQGLDQDDANLLQNHFRIHRGLSYAGGRDLEKGVVLNLDHLLPEMPELRIDFRPVLVAEQQLANVCHPSFQDWDQLAMPEWIATAANAYPIWALEQPVSFIFYTDGSKDTQCHVGSSVVALVDTTQGRRHIGTLAQTLDLRHAFEGEHAAMTWALIWATQLSCFVQSSWPNQNASFIFEFDCASSGYLAAGWWQSSKHQRWGLLLRSLGQILQTSHGFDQVHFNHTYAHVGTLWNEFADCVAKYAARNPHEPQDTPWTAWIDGPIQLNAFQWIWSLFHLRRGTSLLPELRGSTLIHPLQQPDPRSHEEFCPADSRNGQETIPSDHHRLCVDVQFATANVLTLSDPDDTHGPIVGARQLALMQQMFDAHYQIVAVQETRHKRVSQNNDMFHVFGHPAHQGREGIQVWIDKSRPIIPGSQPLAYKDVDVVMANPHY